MTCINCGGEIKQQYIFQGVVVCKDCYTMVTHFVQHAKNEFQMMFLTYTDMLRVALIRGQLRPPRLPEKGSMPAAEFMQAFQDQMRRMTHADGAKKAADGNTQVQPVRSDQEGDGRELRAGSVPQAVPGRRELRPLPQVQADRDPDGSRSPGSAGANDPHGLDQAPRR